ncbi:apaH [Scenedesmus sp. PABB004]|nr:apaH [Scenedesmus sp. PABB004]
MGNCLCGGARQQGLAGPAYERLDGGGGKQLLRSARGGDNLTPAGNPLPPVVHAKLAEHALGDGRLVLVGDVHGCLEELFALLDTLAFDHERDSLIFLGDLCNKGPRSQETVAAVRALCEGRAWAVRGNNDDGALAACARRRSAAWWGLQQGIEPPLAKHAWVGELLPEDVDFLMGLPFSITVEGYSIISVHGGLLPGVPLAEQQLELVLAIRDVVHTPDGS